MKIKESLFERSKQVKKYFALNREATELMKFNLNSNNIDDSIRLVRQFENLKPAQVNSELRYLLNIIKSNECKNICEIGTYKGGSLFLFCQVAPRDARFISIDIYYPFARKHAFQKFAQHHQKICCIEGNTHDPSTEQKIKKVMDGDLLDFIFIDGDHSFFGVMNDYVRFSPLVKKGGIIAFHDIQPDSFTRTGVKTTAYVGGVPDFWLLMKQSNKKTEEMIEDPYQDGCGIGIIFKE